MPAPSKLDTIPPEVRAELDRRLIAGGFGGYVALADWLTEQGYGISKSAVHRYGSALERRLAAIRASTEAARQIAAAAPDDADLRSNAIISLVQTELFEALLSVSEAEDLEPADRVELYSKAAKNIATLTRASIARNQWAAEVKAKAEAAAASVEHIAKRGGLSSESVDAIRREILGIAG